MKLTELLDRIGPVGRVVGAKPRESVFEQHKKHLRERLRSGWMAFTLPPCWCVTAGASPQWGFCTPYGWPTLYEGSASAS